VMSFCLSKTGVESCSALMSSMLIFFRVEKIPDLLKPFSLALSTICCAASSVLAQMWRMTDSCLKKILCWPL